MCGWTSQTSGLIILDDVEEITCPDIILNLEHPTQNQLAMGGEARDVICRDAKPQTVVGRFDSQHLLINI
jgi:hypothetical protein